MNFRLRTRIWTAPALLCGLVLRLWFIAHAQHLSGDTLIYGGIARNWMLHGVYGFVETNGVPQPTLIRLPGYPLFLVCCFRLFGIANYTAVMYAQAALDLASCLLLSILAGRLFGPRVRLATLWAGALCPFTAAYTAAPLTETLTLFSLSLGFYALDRWHVAGAAFNRWLVVVAAALAYSLLLRPEQALLAAAILPAMLWLSFTSKAWVPYPFAALSRKGGFRRVLPALTAALFITVSLVPWTIRNQRTFHVFQPLAPRFATDPGEFIPFGFQRWFRTWAIDYAATEDVYWNYDGAQIALADLPSRAFDSPPQQPEITALLADYNLITSATPELDARFDSLAAARIAAHPLRYYAALPAARLVNMLLRPRTETLSTHLEWWRFHEHRRESIFALASALLNLAYFALGAWGAVLWQRSRVQLPMLYAMLAFIVLRCALLLTLDNSEPRYTLEFFPILFLLAALPLLVQMPSDVINNPINSHFRAPEAMSDLLPGHKFNEVEPPPAVKPRAAKQTQCRAGLMFPVRP